MEKNYDIENFAAVWSRVMPETEAPEKRASEDIGEKLPLLIESKAQSMRCYAFLARKYAGKKAGDKFKALSKDEKMHLKKLQTAYYILTGDTYALKNEQIKIVSVLSVLRESFLRERESEKAFILASLNDDEPKRTDLFLKIAADDKRHADILEEIIENTL